MNNIAEQIVQDVQNAESSFFKFISANDVGKTTKGNTRSHQSGYYIPISFCEKIFETAIQRGTDYEQFVTVKWQNDFETDSRFKFFGSKNECHLTRLGRDFPFRKDDNMGDVIIISKVDKEHYKAYVLSTDDDIEEVFAALNISAGDTNRIISKKESINADSALLQCFHLFVKELNRRFPTTTVLSKRARDCYNSCYNITNEIVKQKPDESLLRWLDSEFQLFKAIELNFYSEMLTTPFSGIEELIEIANTILNRRKSRAGKSLEHHLGKIFEIFGLDFSPQAVTEGKKKPDFIFPSGELYQNKRYDPSKLVFLAAKTTCKDRWRQIINEADRIRIKHLFTLQESISKNQLDEMYGHNVKLVVPELKLKTFPEEYQNKIFTLQNFIDYTVSIQR